jgi:hypothetical protein
MGRADQRCRNEPLRVSRYSVSRCRCDRSQLIHLQEETLKTVHSGRRALDSAIHEIEHQSSNLYSGSSLEIPH